MLRVRTAPTLRRPLRQHTVAASRQSQQQQGPTLRRRTRIPQPKAKEPFDAELVTLFGVPVLVLGAAYALNEPKSLAIALPICLLLPGVRDVIWHVGTDMWKGASKARRFVLEADEDAAEDAAAQLERQRRERWSQQAKWSRPPPPPPPPPPMAEYELGQEEYSVYPATPNAPASPSAHGWPPSVQVPRSPFSDGWPPVDPSQQPYFEGSAAWQQQQQQQQWQEQQQQQQQAPPDAYAAWNAPPPSPYAADSSNNSNISGNNSGNSSGSSSGNGSFPGGYQGSANRQRPYGNGPPSATAPSGPPPGSQGVTGGLRGSNNRRNVRPTSKKGGRVGAKKGAGRDGEASLLRPVFALAPFLKFWGGFL